MTMRRMKGKADREIRRRRSYLYLQNGSSNEGLEVSGIRTRTEAMLDAGLC